MMKRSRLEDDQNIQKKNIMKDVRNLFRLNKTKKRKEITNDAAIKVIRNLLTKTGKNKLNSEYVEKLEIFLSIKKIIESSKSR